MGKYKAVIFDFDGTLVESDYIIVDSAAKAIKNLGRPKKELASVRRHFREQFGLHSRTMILKILPNLDKKTLLAFDKEFHKILLPRYRSVRAFPFAKKTLAWLAKQGFKLAIWTSSPQAHMRQRLSLFGMSSSFHVIIGREHVRRLRPDPDGIFKACKLLRVKPNEAIYVGDTRYDVMAGRRAGSYVVAFRPKYLSLSRAKPNITIQSWKVFPKLVGRLNR